MSSQASIPIIPTSLRALDSLPAPESGLVQTERDGLILIGPRKGQKMSHSDWSQDELWMRSMLVRAEAPHEIVSVGFPKFFNHGEGDDHSLEAALASGQEVLFTDKVDGSLAIRSVIDGRVNWRTRGTFDGGDMREAIEAAARRYPILADPGFGGGLSLLFEFVSPAFRIVISYSEPDLVLLGAVDLSSLELVSIAECGRIAEENELHLVELHALPTEPERLIGEISSWAGREGVVARYRDQHSLGQCREKLVKLKSADYLHRHRLRFALTARVIREVCQERGVTELGHFEEYLAEQGGDWELAEEARPLVAAYIEAIAIADRRLQSLLLEVEEMNVRYPVRKDFALEYATRLHGASKSAAFAILSSAPDKAKELLRREELDRAFARAETEDELLQEALEG